MIDLYYWPTPNGRKIPIFLEEADLQYQIKSVSLSTGEQFKPEFLTVSPSAKIPAIVDHRPLDRATPISIFESGAILIYLSEKTGRFLSLDVRKRTETLQWLFWQNSALGPALGRLNYFAKRAPKKNDDAVEHFQKESDQLLSVLEYRLAYRSFVATDYSIADMAIYPWVAAYENSSQFPHVNSWKERIHSRPAIQRAYLVSNEN